MRTMLPNIMIFSVFNFDVNKDVNEIAHSVLLDNLKAHDIPHIELLGMYKGREEKSILISGFEHREIVESTCKAFRQECYLESYHDRACALVYPDGKRVSVGTMTAVSKAEAQAQDSFSYNPVGDQYFITKATF